MQSIRSWAIGKMRNAISPLVPSRKKLAFMWWMQVLAGNYEPELLKLSHFAGAAGVAIDIGANVGWYTYSLSKHFRRVYAFEINEEVTHWIRQYNPGNIEIIHCGISSAVATAKFYVPFKHGVPQSGWGSLDRDNALGADSYVEKEVRLAPLDDFNIGGIDFIKIDVEGHEFEVLKGAHDTISKSRPTVLIEVRDSNLQQVDNWFSGFQYLRYELKDLVGVSGQKGNYIYLPRERSLKLNQGPAPHLA